MTIVHVKVLTGPNYWSVKRHRLIELLLDIEELEHCPTSSITGFYERLVALMPSLYSHKCSEGREGGFLYRVKTGTWMGHIVEHLSLELQTLAGMNTGFGRTRHADKKGVYQVVFSYVDAEAGVYAAQAAVNIAQALVVGAYYDLGHDLLELHNIWMRNKMGPSTQSIVDEALRRDIPVIRLDNEAYVQLGYGKHQKRIEASIACTSSSIAVDLVSDKNRTKIMLAEAKVPVPAGTIVSTENELQHIVETVVGYPLVVKPLNGNHGNGTTTNIDTPEQARAAFVRAKKYCEQVICERYITGDDYRVLVVDYKFVAAALRTPASVIGDGCHTVRELVDIINQHPLRGQDHDNVLTKIVIDQASEEILCKQLLTPDSILPWGRELLLKPTANLSTGGTATNVTDRVHPANIALFERAARVLGLNLCGIDVMAPALDTKLQENGGAIIEVNAAPGLRMHLFPSSGASINVAKPIIDMLFPEQSPSRIPIIAITGTNGKTTTTRLIAHIMKTAGFFTGYTTTDGVYAGDEMIDQGDCSGPSSAALLLKDPAIEVAVLECARGGLLRSGLGFDRCDVGVVTNVAEDHLGLQAIHSLEQLAKVKSVIPESVSPLGTAVLNADDNLVYRMKDKIECDVALFSMSENNSRIRKHVRAGGTAAVYSDNQLLLYKNNEAIVIGHAEEIPCTFDGKALFNVANVLAATLACVSINLPMEVIRRGLFTFRNSAEQTPGRMNIFAFNGYQVLLDYAHNPHGLRALGDFIKKIDCRKKIGIVTAVGDRRDEDIVAMGEAAARIFDEIIVRHDKDLRGRSPHELDRLMQQGILQVDNNKNVRCFADEKEAIEFGFNGMENDYLLVMLMDDIWDAIRIVKEKMKASVRSVENSPIAV